MVEAGRTGKQASVATPKPMIVYILTPKFFRPSDLAGVSRLRVAHYRRYLLQFPARAKMRVGVCRPMFPLAIAAAAAAKLAKIAAAAPVPEQKKYSPGSKAPASGIYGCVDCKTKRTVMKGRRLPPCHGGWVVIQQTT